MKKILLYSQTNLLIYFFFYVLGMYVQSLLLGLVLLGVSLVYQETQYWKEEEREVKLRLASLSPKNLKQLLNHVSPQVLPPWIRFPDVEHAEWINKILHQSWPSISCYLKDFVEYKLESHLRWNRFKCQFKKVEVGEQAPRVTGVKVYDALTPGEVILDLDFVYTGDVAISVSIDWEGIKTPFNCTMRKIKVSGSMRVTLKLLPRPPFIASLHLLSTTRPDFSVEFDGLLSHFEELIRPVLQEAVKSLSCKQHNFTIAEDLPTHRSPEPQGVLRIIVHGSDNPEAEKCKISFGPENFTAKNPWNNVFETICYSHTKGSGLMLHIELLNSVNDSLFREAVSIAEIIKRQQITFTTNVHLEILWLKLNDRLELLNLEGDHSDKRESCGVLKVWVESYQHTSRQSELKNELAIQLELGRHKEVVRGQLCYDNNLQGLFQNGVDFLITDPHQQELQLKVLEDTEQMHKLALDYLVHKPRMEHQGCRVELPNGSSLTLSLHLWGLQLAGEHSDQVSKKEDEDSLSEYYHDAGSLLEAASAPTTTTQPAQPASRTSHDTSTAMDSLDGPEAPCSFEEPDVGGSVTASASLSSPLGSATSQELRYMGQVKLAIRYGRMSNLSVTILKTELSKSEADKNEWTQQLQDWTHEWTVHLKNIDPYKDRTKKKLRVTSEDKAQFEISINNMELTQHLLVVSFKNKLNKKSLGKVKMGFRSLDINKPVIDWYDLEVPGEHESVSWIDNKK